MRVVEEIRQPVYVNNIRTRFGKIPGVGLRRVPETVIGRTQALAISGCDRLNMTVKELVFGRNDVAGFVFRSEGGQLYRWPVSNLNLRLELPWLTLLGFALNQPVEPNYAYERICSLFNRGIRYSNKGLIPTAKGPDLNSDTNNLEWKKAKDGVNTDWEFYKKPGILDRIRNWWAKL